MVRPANHRKRMQAKPAPRGLLARPEWAELPEPVAAEAPGRMQAVRLERVATAPPVVVARAEALVPAALRAPPAAGAVAPEEAVAPFRMPPPTEGLSCSWFRFTGYWRQKNFQGLCFKSRSIS
jgi:hypothetical protein